MTLEDAIKILQQHNKWRRGLIDEMVHPLLLGKAIDYAIKVLKKLHESK